MPRCRTRRCGPGGSCWCWASLPRCRTRRCGPGRRRRGAGGQNQTVFLWARISSAAISCPRAPEEPSARHERRHSGGSCWCIQRYLSPDARSGCGNGTHREREGQKTMESTDEWMGAAGANVDVVGELVRSERPLLSPRTAQFPATVHRWCSLRVCREGVTFMLGCGRYLLWLNGAYSKLYVRAALDLQHWQRPRAPARMAGAGRRSRCRPCGGSLRRAGGQGQPLTSSIGSGPGPPHARPVQAGAAGAGPAGVAFARPEVRGSP